MKYKCYKDILLLLTDFLNFEMIFKRIYYIFGVIPAVDRLNEKFIFNWSFKCFI